MERHARHHLRQDEPLLCLHLNRPDMPEMHYWPKVAIESEHGMIPIDALLRIKEGNKVVWLALEIDEDPLPTADSLRREALVPLPTVRLGPDDVLSYDCMQRLFAKARPYLDAAA